MRKKRRSAYLLESLEARLLFSADLAPLPVDGGTSGAEFESSLEISLQPDSAGVQEADENTQERQEVIFVDSGVDDYQQLIDDIESQLEKGRQFDIVSLDSDSDGIDQISAYLRQHEGIDAVHVVSHGSEDAVKLGNVWLTPDKLDAYADAIEGWQQTLSSDADLLFYGCNLAAGEGGQDLVNSLTLLTGADVAASDDVTGSAKLGGDWDLEYSRGAIETAVAFSPEVQQNWNEVLTTFIVNTTTDTIDNNLGDGIAEDAAGNTSLRAAIMEANALGGAHEIILNPGTYTLSLGELEITSDLTINGADARTTLIDGNGSDRVFKIDNNSMATLNGITIMNGNQNNSGGVFINGGSTLYLSDAIVRDNTSDRGGGMHVHGTANLERVLLYNNTANEGGAIHFHGADGGSLINVTISGNDATSRGGGLWTDSVITVTNCTITLNDAPDGGGIVHSGGTVNISNTIVAENLAGSNPDVKGTFSSQGNNLIGDKGTASGFTNGVNGDQVGTAGSPIDPLLNSLQDNGGFTQTHALLSGSPAIDPAGLSGAPPYDQRGFVRDVTPDIGAFEYNGANTAPTLTVTGAVTVKKGTVYTLNLSASDPDSHTITSWTINWGDGTIETIPGNPSSVTHTYTQAGFTYNITVSATDITGTYIAGDMISTSMQNDSLYWFDANTGLVIDIENLPGPGDNPIDAQFGPDGEIYVTAFASNKIYRYNADGSFDTTFVDGSGLNGPSRIAFGPDGNLYVTNMFTNQVLRFSGVDGISTGTAMGAFISTGLDEPDGITFGPDGNLYVANKGTGNVLRFDGVTGTLDPTFLANGPSGFNGYMDIQFGPDGRLWVTNQFIDDIRRYNATDGAYVDTFASTGATDFAGIAFGPDGYVYLSDAMAEDKIIRYPIGDGSAPEPFVWSGTGGLDQPVNIVFTPAHQVKVIENNAPTATNLTTTSSYNEGDASVDITDIVVTDVDSGEMITATLTLNDTTTGSLSANDGATYDGGTGIWTITDTVANVNVALANLVFNPNSDNDVDTTITTHIEDAAGAGPADGTITLDVTPVNDAPTATNMTSTSAYNEGDSPVAITDIVVTDVDSGEMITATLTLNDTTTGSLSANDGATYDGGTGIWTITDTVANVNVALANLVFNPNSDNDVDTTITTHIEDAAGAGPADGTITLDVTPVNDAPTATNMTSTSAYNEGDSPVAITDIVVTDVDSGEMITATLTLNDTTTGSLSANDGATYDGGTGIWTITDTVANVNVALANLVFNPNSDNDVDTTITTHIEDAAGAGPADGTITLDVTPANDAPTATNMTSTSSYNEGDSPVAITDIVVTDVDSGDTITATLTLNDTSTGSLSANDGATYDGGTGIWTITDTIANVNVALANLVFNPNSDNDVDTTIITHIEDAAGAGPADGTITLDVTPANDAPVINNASFSVDENSTNGTVVGNVPVTDPDAGDTHVYSIIAGNTGGAFAINNAGNITVANSAALNFETTPIFTLTVQVQDQGGTGLTDTATITVSLNDINDTGTVTIDNTTPAQGDTLTANVIDPDGASGAISFQWLSDGVVIGGATGKTYTTTQSDVGAVMTVTAIYTDDQGTAESLTSAPTAVVTNVNDTPIAVNDNLNATEDQSMTFTSVTDLLGNDSDIDGDTLTISSLSQPANGSLTDNGDGTFTYTPAGNFSGIDSFSYTISDSNGGIATGTAIVVVAPVGDTPQVTNVSTNAEVQSGLINIDRNANDGAEVTHFKISGITNGSLYLADGVSRIDNGDFITVGQGQAGLRFTPAANSTADGNFNVESSEDGVSVASQSGIATSTISILTMAPQPSEPVPSPPPSDPEEVVSEETEQEESEELEDVADETDVQAVADDMASAEAPQNAKAPGNKKASLVPGISVFKRADFNSNHDRTPGRSSFLSPQTLKKLVESENLGELKTALGKLDITTLPPDVYELVRGSLDAVQEEMGNEILIGKTVLGSAIATSVGLSAGYVVWMLKGGSLLASVLSSLPAWQLADPLAILVGKIEDEDEDEDDDTLETIIKDGSRRNEDKESKASELDKHKKEPTKR